MDDFFSCFKFRHINKYFIASLVNPSLYFAQPSALNDPFDCQLNLCKILKNSFPKANENQKYVLKLYLDNSCYFADFESKLARIGVFSATEDIRETLLWSHYADEHKGVCIGYKIPVSKYIAEGKLLGSSKVSYADNLSTQILSILPNKITGGTLTEFNDNLVKLYLTTKSPAWSYEKEKRIIRNKPGYFEIPNDYIEKICFGLQTPKEDISLVIKLAEKFSYCIDFRQMVRDGTNFGFSATPL